MSAFVSRARATVAGLAEAVDNPAIRRALLAYLIGVASEAGLLVVLAVTAYRVAGPVGVAFVGAARTLPVIVFGLASSAPLARWRADRVLMALAAIRGLAAAATGVALLVGAPAWVLYATAAVLGAVAAMVTAVQYTILPALARSPRELVVGNVATSAADAAGTLGGPLIAGACIALGAAGAMGLIASLLLAVSIWLLSGVRFEHQADASGPERRTGTLGLGLGAGLRAIRRRPAVGLLIAGFGLQTLVRGLLALLLVVLSIDQLELGEAGLGLLTAAIGFGGVFGMVGSLVLRTATPMAFSLSLVGWGLPIAFIGGMPGMAMALGALAVVGASNGMVDVIGYTLLQRSCRNEDRGAVIALLEATAGIGTAIGSIMAPALLGWLGIRGALVATGAILPVAAIVLLVLFRRTGANEVVPSATIDSLRRVPAFRALPLTGLERLVAGRSQVAFAAGEVLMRKGDLGDRFLVIEAGSVQVSDGDRVLDTLGPGAGIGEIALLRGGPRTATVTALSEGEALAFDAGTFLAAVAGPAASAAAEHVVEARLERSRTATAA